MLVAVIIANQFHQEFLNMPAIMRKILISRKINGVKPSGHFRPFLQLLLGRSNWRLSSLDGLLPDEGDLLAKVTP